ncbi:hypothetical protein FHS14_000882 [Paenibacillus baekrokdamisoli]|nr:hypothetical protein [Paenibacillus baekrokdamisoli]
MSAVIFLLAFLATSSIKSMSCFRQPFAGAEKRLKNSKSARDDHLYLIFADNQLFCIAIATS